MAILYSLFVTLFVILCLFLVLIILIQQGKSSIGMGSLGGGTQLLFGGSGGQDIFQKITWVLGALFMLGSLILSLMKSSGIDSSRYLDTIASRVPTEASAPLIPGGSEPVVPTTTETQSNE